MPIALAVLDGRDYARGEPVRRGSRFDGFAEAEPDGP
jgi:hypothetical protein